MITGKGLLGFKCANMQMCKCANEAKIYQKFFTHFAQRLIERYNVFITYEEYVFLSKLPFLRTPKMRIDKVKNKHCVEGFLTIQGQKVRVLKSAIGEAKQLLTALPLKKK